MHSARWYSPVWDLFSLRNLIACPQFPLFESMWGGELLSSWSAIIVAVLFIASFPALRRDARYSSIMAGLVATGLLFGSDRRFLYPYLSLILPHGVEAIRSSRLFEPETWGYSQSWRLPIPFKMGTETPPSPAGSVPNKRQEDNDENRVRVGHHPPGLAAAD
jgi:hypothetical protein